MQTSDTIARLYLYLVKIILLEKNVEKCYIKKFYTIYKGYFYGKKHNIPKVPEETFKFKDLKIINRQKYI